MWQKSRSEISKVSALYKHFLKMIFKCKEGNLQVRRLWLTLHKELHEIDETASLEDVNQREQLK